MGHGLTGVGLRTGPTHGVDDVQVKEHVVEAAVIRQPIEHFADGLLGLKRCPPGNC